MSAPDSGVLDQLARFVTNARFVDLPADVVDAARLRLLDVLGSALWGVHAGTAAGMRAVVESSGGAPEASVIGRRIRLPATSAAYLNSCASPALLDTCRFSVTHPGIVTVPAALAAAQLARADGRELVLSVVLGYEVLVRMGLHARVADRGFVPTALLGPFGSAAASARLLGCDAKTTANALAISAGMGAGLLDAYSAIDSARSQFGRASQGGLLSTLLARQGISGNRTILEGGSMEGTPGFFEAFGAPGGASEVTRGLGDDFAILRVAPKIHDGCRYTNAAADATLELMRKRGLKPHDVARIRIGTFSLALSVSVRHPTTVSGALFCMEFVVATALLCGDVFNHRFTLERLNDPAVQDLMSKVSVGLDEAMDAAYPQRLGLRLDVDTVNGETLRCEVAFPKGERENPLTTEECEAKFLHLASPLAGMARARDIVGLIRRLETLASVDPLLSLCEPPP